MLEFLNSAPSDKKNFFAFLLLLLGSFVLYGQTLGYFFVWDDLILILDNDALRKWSNLGAFFTTPFFKLAAGINFPHHRPMVPLLILLTSTFSGTNPFGYHLLNICLHALASWLLYLFLQQLPLKNPLRFLAVGIFLVHPIHSEAVAWPCSAAVLAGSVFFMTGLIFSSRLSGASGRSRHFYLVGVFLSYVFGLMSYDLVLILPAVIFFCDMLVSEEGRKKPGIVRWVELGVLAAAAVIFVAIRYRLADQMGGFSRFQHGDPNAANIILSTAGDGFYAVLNALSRYSENLIFPAVLTPEAYFAARQFSWSAVISLVLVIILSGMVLYQTRGKKKIFIFSLIWTGLAFLPLIQIIFQGGLFADRYLYLASLGFSLWLAMVLNHIWEFFLKRFQGLTPLCGVLMAAGLLSFYSLKTLEQNRIWHDDLTFWTAASILSPDKPRVHHLLGVSLMRFDQPERAVEAFQRAVKLSPNYPHPYQGLAFAYRVLGKEALAEEAERKSASVYEVYRAMMPPQKQKEA